MIMTAAARRALGFARSEVAGTASTARRLRGAKSGVAAVEFALIVPFLMTLYFGLVDLTLGFAVLDDGARFLVARRVADPDGSTPSITVVQNWFAEFAGQRAAR